jgi:hypothetical protein
MVVNQIGTGFAARLIYASEGRGIRNVAPYQ